jgi:hypothetical protein
MDTEKVGQNFFHPPLCVLQDPHHIDADPDPAFDFNADPTFLSFSLMGSRPYHSLFQDLDPSMLQKDPLRLPPFQFDADLDSDPAIH